MVPLGLLTPAVPCQPDGHLGPSQNREIGTSRPSHFPTRSKEPREVKRLEGATKLLR